MSGEHGLDRSTLLMVAFSVAMSVVSQVILRQAMGALAEASGVALALGALRSPEVWLGLGLYGLGTLSWLAVLSRIDLAVAYPLGSSNYVLVTLLAAFVLHEDVGALRWAGTALILTGIVVIARGESNRPGAHDAEESR